MNKKVKKRPPTKDKTIIEDDGDKRTIVYIAIAIVVIIGIVIGLLVGCQKKEEEKDPGEEIIIPTEEVKKKEDVVEEYEIEEEERVVTTVVKTNNKTAEKKKYLVTFYYNNNLQSYRTEVTEGEKVAPHLPKGYDSCEYFTEEDTFDFDTKINSKTSITMECTPTEYTVKYIAESITTTDSYKVTDTDSVLTYYSPSTGMFVGWFASLDNGVYSNKVNVLSPSIIKYADENNVITLYAKIVEEIKVSYYDYNGREFNQQMIIQAGFLAAALPGSILEKNACPEDTTFYGWSLNESSNVIAYKENELMTVDDNMELYAVCGASKVIYVSEAEDGVNKVEVEVAITEEEIPEYVAPEHPSDVGIETPTYYLPVEDDTLTSKNVVADDEDEITDQDIKLSEATNKAAENYTPKVGDKIEEHEKEFVGWTTEDTKENSPTEGEQIPVDDEFEPVAGEETELNAVWKEPIVYEAPEEDANEEQQDEIQNEPENDPEPEQGSNNQNEPVQNPDPPTV